MNNLYSFNVFLNFYLSTYLSLFESGKSPYIHTDTHTHAQNTIYNKRRNHETVERENSTSK